MAQSTDATQIRPSERARRAAQAYYDRWHELPKVDYIAVSAHVGHGTAGRALQELVRLLQGGEVAPDAPAPRR